MKKLVSILLAGSMAFSLLPGTAFAADVTGTFTYNETFDTVSAGLPAGWTIYTPSAAANTEASVSDGALTLTNTTNNGEWILFDALSTVKNQSLVMECDITHLDNAAGNENSVAGLAYMVDIGQSSTTNIDDTHLGSTKDESFTGLKGNYAALKTDSANSYQQVSVRRQKTDRRVDAFNAPRDSANKETDSGVTAMNKNNCNPIHLKIAYKDVKRYPYIYINGVELMCNTAAGFNDLYTGSSTDQAMKDGKVGFYIKNANVKIDNLKISGTGTYTDATAYKASFKSSAAKYVSIEAAKADILVAEYDCFGTVKTDVTSSATIEGIDNGNGTGTVNVTYGDYTKVLTCKLGQIVQRGFVYEENFDAMADGSLPTGWTIYTPSAAANTEASVSDGALTLTNTTNNGEWILFDALSTVKNQSLVMECDITHLDNAAGDENSIAGLAYMVDTGTSSTTNIDDTHSGSTKDTAFTGLKGNYAALKTDSTNSDQLVSVRRQKTDRRGDVFTAPRDSANQETASGVTAMNKNNGNPIHLKIQYQNVKYLPYIYINGVNVIKNIDAGFNDLYSGSNSDQAMLSGKVGFYIKNANVKIDNIKITGTRSDFVPDADSLAISKVKYDSANKKLNVMADASLTAVQSESANSAIIAAVYDNNDRLVSAKTVSVDASKVVDYHGTIAINGVSSEPAAGKVKLFLWDMTDINPLIQNAVK